MQDVKFDKLVWGARSLPPHKTGTVHAILPCTCKTRSLADRDVDGPAEAFHLEFRVIGEPPYVLKGVPCGCGSGRSYTVELNVEPQRDDPWRHD